MKLNKTKIITLVLLAVVFAAGTVWGFCLSGVCEKENAGGKAGGFLTEFVFSPGTPKEIELNVGESKKGYITVKGDFEGYRLISSENDIVHFYAEKMSGTDRIYYTISAVSVGEAEVYIETADGKIKSDEIKVTVISNSEN